MQAQNTQNAQDPANRTEKLQDKKARYTWWQSLLLLVGTLVICLGAGYFISSKYFWNQGNDQLTKQLTYYKAQVDKKPNDANLRVQLGYTYLLEGDTQEAIKQYNTAKNLDSKNYGAYLNLAIAYDKEKRNDDALDNAIKAEKLAPNDYKPKLIKARTYRKLKMYSKATTALQEANRLKPGNTDIIYETGLIAEAQGKKKDAEKIYKDALSYDPTYKPALKALDRLNGKNN